MNGDGAKLNVSVSSVKVFGKNDRIWKEGAPNLKYGKVNKFKVAPRSIPKKY